jgi:hypothetical protein
MSSLTGGVTMGSYADSTDREDGACHPRPREPPDRPSTPFRLGPSDLDRRGDASGAPPQGRVTEETVVRSELLWVDQRSHRCSTSAMAVRMSWYPSPFATGRDRGHPRLPDDRRDPLGAWPCAVTVELSPGTRQSAVLPGDGWPGFPSGGRVRGSRLWEAGSTCAVWCSGWRRTLCATESPRRYCSWDGQLCGHAPRDRTG